jgi:LPXTG-site transpeptidase (sortase) family protein
MRALCRVALGWILLGSASAAGANEAGQAAAAPPPGAYQVWIQDPWTGDVDLRRVPAPDQSLWNGARVDDYHAALAAEAAPPLGILTIPRLGVEVPVYNGTDEFNLDRGLGRILGMARPGEMGNLGISGHRDGFFRVLKDVQEGDRIMVRTPRRVETYVVDRITVVDKHDESLLLVPSEDRMLTLVTCYPFYFVGHAPKRFIVQAHTVNPAAEALPPEAVAVQ